MNSTKHNVFFLVTFTLLAVIFGIAIITLDQWRDLVFLDDLTILLSIPIFYSIFYYPRKVFYTMIVINALIAIWILSTLNQNQLNRSYESLITFACILTITGEIVHRAKTKRQQAEESLGKSEKRYEDLLYNLPVGVYRYTPRDQGHFTAANPVIVKMFGYDSLKEFMKTSVEELYADPNQQRVSSYRLLREGHFFGHILKLKKKDGTLFWASVTANTVRNSEGEIEYFDGIIEDITNRKQVEESLYESRQLLQIVLNSIPTGVFWKDLDSIYIGCNRKFAQDAGLESQEAIVGKNDYDLSWKKDEADFFRECDRRVMDSDTPEYHIVEPQLHADGKQAWVDTNKIPLHDEEGHVAGIIGTYEDITERIETDRELMKYRENLEALVETRTRELTLTNTQLQEEILYREQAENELKYLLSLEEAISKVSRHFVTFEGADLNETLRILGQAVSANRAYIYLMRGNGRMDNTHEWCAPGTESDRQEFQNFDPAEYPWTIGKLENDEAKVIPDVNEMPPEAEYEKQVFQSHNVHALLAVPIRSVVGRFLGFMGFDDTENCRQWQENDVRILRIVGQMIANDLERKRVGKRLRLLNSAVEQSSEGLGVIDLRGNLLYLNEAFAKMHGYELDELFGRNMSILHTPEQMSAVDEANRQILETGRFMGEIWHKKQNGDVFPSMMNNTLLRDSKGNPVGMVGTLRNVTALKQAENELLAAKELAESANRAKSQFLANMSHELRTPLYGMVGMIDLLSNTSLNTSQIKYVDKVRQSGQSLLEVINNVLDFSKIEAGKVDLEEIEFDIRQTVENTVDLYANHAFMKELNLTCLIDTDIPPIVRGDPVRLRQILSNLILNAIKFTYRGSITIRAVPLEERSDSMLLRFDVCDTGIGIDSDAQQTIFESFTQADGSTTRKFGGTGLGLAISKQLTEMMGGTIDLESEPDQGSTFRFTVQLGKTHSPPKSESIFGSDRQSLHALIVDSNSLNRSILHKQISAWGLTVEEAANATNALERLQQSAMRSTPIDIVLFSANLPDTNGLEFAKTIKYDISKSDVHLLMFTALGAYYETEKQHKAEGFEWPCAFVRQSQIHTTIAEATGWKQQTVQLLPTEKIQSGLEETTYHAHVLVVEDIAINLDVTVGMLTFIGCRVETALNGRKALEIASQTNYDIIFMDCQMPVMDGYEATISIRQSEQSGRAAAPHTIIVGLTAHALKGDRERCLAAGMNDYLSKPFGLERLRELMDRWIPHKRDPLNSRNPSPPIQHAPPLSPPLRQTSSIDWNALDTIHQLRTQKEPDILKKAVTHFLNDSSALVKSLRLAVETADLPACLNIAHSLKSASFNVGAVNLAEQCHKLEQENSLESASTVLLSIEDEYDEVESILKEILKQGLQQ